ncbi:asparaginase [Nocardia arthritidis]|uniref:Asparaginase n=2 Tax=Nocardia arthritidis TaxID=228602 RepID=A0A6G9YQ88_9NOCA|nr:asparaginase [Nocardia arthritidis]
MPQAPTVIGMPRTKKLRDNHAHRIIRGSVALLASAAVLGGSAVGGLGVAVADPTGQPVKPTVAVIGLGGTIAGASDRRTNVETYEPGKLSISDLVGSLHPEVADVADVSTEEFGHRGSTDYTLADYYDLARLIDQRLADHDAVVVSSGTATMEELAYFLDLTVRSTKPVVVTGAMRPWTAIGSDGPPNLYNAIRLGASGRTKCFGTTVTLNDQIFPARDATKTDSTRLNTFTTREYGDLGTIDEAGVRLQRAPARIKDCGDPGKWETPFDLSTITRESLPRVEIASAYLAAAGEPVTADVGAGAKGIVFAGTPSPGQMTAATAAAGHGVAVVAANGYGAGAISVDPKVGVISAGDLAPKKARILLLLALTKTADTHQISEWFRRYGNEQF